MVVKAKGKESARVRRDREERKKYALRKYKQKKVIPKSKIGMKIDLNRTSKVHPALRNLHQKGRESERVRRDREERRKYALKKSAKKPARPKAKAKAMAKKRVARRK